jgi:hypothetical protein
MERWKALACGYELGDIDRPMPKATKIFYLKRELAELEREA